MRITYLHQYFNTPQMSGGTRSYEFAKRLVEKGHEVNMITSWRTDEKKEKLVENIDGINVHWIPVPYDNRMGFFRRLMAFFSFAHKSAHIASTLPSDIIYASSTPLTIALPAVWASKRKKIPMVFEVRDLWPEAAIAIGVLKNPVLIYAAKILEKFAYANSAKVIALSPYMAQGVISSGYKEKNITIISNSSDLEFFDPKNASSNWFNDRIPDQDNKIIATYAGTIGKINNIPYLVEIAQICKTIIPNLKFAIIGEGAEKEKVKNLATQSNVLDKNFFIFASVAKNEMPDILASSSFCLSFVQDNPKLSGNSANKFFDSLASAKPICINHQGWLAELIEKYNTGLVLPANDAKKAADMLQTWLSEERNITQSSEAALKLAKSHFDRDEQANELEKIFLKTVNSKL